jgi:hypothetical protein
MGKQIKHLLMFLLLIIITCTFVGLLEEYTQNHPSVAKITYAKLARNGMTYTIHTLKVIRNKYNYEI